MTPWRVALRNFWHCETKKIRRKSWYFPLPLIHKLFRYQNFSETQHRRVPLRNISALWDRKFSTENLDIPPPTPSHPNLSIPVINDTLKCSPTKFFGAVRQKIFDGKFRYSPLLIYKLFRYRKLSEIQHRRVPLQSFSILRDKKVRQKIVR